MSLVPDGFSPPDPPTHPQVRLELLGPKHNESDYAAWMGSFDFIKGLPGWSDSSWPHRMTLEANLGDLVSHEERSAAGHDFAYTVLQPDTDEVIGCVYLTRPAAPQPGGVQIRSWVVEAQAALDKPLHDLVLSWVRAEWPFTEITYAGR